MSHPILNFLSKPPCLSYHFALYSRRFLSNVTPSQIELSEHSVLQKAPDNPPIDSIPSPTKSQIIYDKLIGEAKTNLKPADLLKDIQYNLTYANPSYKNDIFNSLLKVYGDLTDQKYPGFESPHLVNNLNRTVAQISREKLFKYKPYSEKYAAILNIESILKKINAKPDGHFNTAKITVFSELLVQRGGGVRKRSDEFVEVTKGMGVAKNALFRGLLKIALDRKNLSKADRILKDFVVSEDSKNALFYRIYMKELIRTGDSGRIVKTLRKLSRATNTLIEDYFPLIQCYLLFEKYAEARAILESFEGDIKSPEAIELRFRTRVYNDEFDLAVKEFSETIKKDSKDGDLRAPNANLALEIAASVPFPVDDVLYFADQYRKFAPNTYLHVAPALFLSLHMPSIKASLESVKDKGETLCPLLIQSFLVREKEEAIEEIFEFVFSESIYLSREILKESLRVYFEYWREFGSKESTIIKSPAFLIRFVQKHIDQFYELKTNILLELLYGMVYFRCLKEVDEVLVLLRKHRINVSLRWKFFVLDELQSHIDGPDVSDTLLRFLDPPKVVVGEVNENNIEGFAFDAFERFM
ncbi:hypothetical protein HK098_007367 [Nowakowskiella sp. JEL0407]|nr:hypothetical protein HK098_007367 [Nowakowskiella sp. JEL0407]